MPSGQTEVLKDAGGNTLASTSLSYTYDVLGNIETIAEGGTQRQKYYYDSLNQLIREDNRDLNQTIVYSYDLGGAPIAFSMENTPVLYFYRKNLQGDVTGVYKGSTGTLLVSYVYDAWGKVTATDVASTTESAKVLTYNPYLYRGYRYDTETGLYYLNSRYYDPETGRFINADDVSNIGADGMLLGHNLYAYCDNNPISRIDVNGEWSLPNWAKVAIGAVATVAAVAVTVVTGGAAVPVLVSVATSTAISGAIGYATKGTEGLKDGLANGLMLGGLGALGGSVISAGVKAVKTAQQGITIGRNMEKVNRAAGLTDTLTYSDNALWKPLNPSIYSGIKKQ